MVLIHFEETNDESNFDLHQNFKTKNPITHSKSYFDPPSMSSETSFQFSFAVILSGTFMDQSGLLEDTEGGSK